MKKYYLLIFLLFNLSVSFGQQTGSVRGVVKDILTETVIANATVSIVGTDFNTFTNGQGEFYFIEVPVGRLEISISSVGYTTLVLKELLLATNKELVIETFLETAINELDEVKVTANSPNLSQAMTSVYAISVEQVMRFPATFFDPARLAFSFPGVANTNDQANGMSIRGNNPKGLQWRLEGIEIVNPNHLANAGTFSDQASANAGGTNMVSAQMMGNINFLTGAFPAEYGNALSGIMDLRLRKGNNKEHEYTAQVGLIGVDLAAEGPLNKAKGSSYLVNYRYSFTGLLALGGLSFGGETIKFQDLALNLSFPNQKFGDVTLFGMGGLNSNEFAFKREDGGSLVFEKDKYLIDYYGKMGASGVTHTKRFSPTKLWKNAIVYSGLQNERSQVNPLSSSAVPYQHDFSETSKISLSSIFIERLSSTTGLKSGIYISKTADSLTSIQNKLAGEFSSWIIQPFVQYYSDLGSRINFTLGVHYLKYQLNKSSSLEPRANLGVVLSSKSNLNIAYGRHSQLFDSWLYAGNIKLKPTQSDHFVLKFDTKMKESASLTAEVYYQSIFHDLSGFGSYGHLSGINLTEFVDPTLFVNRGKSRNYGLEINYSRYLANGFFALINATLYKSEYLANGVYYQARYSGSHIFNLTFGKEWEVSKDRVLGVNTRIVWMGGFRNYEIDLVASKSEGKTVFQYSKPLTVRLPDYFRPDLRVYLKRSKTKLNRMWSIDIQNVANYQNVAFDYYDAFQAKVIRKYQLGLIPMLNYRWEF